MKNKELISKGAKIGKNVIIDKSVRIINPKNLIIKKGTRIDFNTILICKKKMIIESNVHIGPNSILRSHQALTIGKNTLISSFVDIFTSSSEVKSEKNYSHPIMRNHSKNDKKINIGSFSFIGSHCVILPGANLTTGTHLNALTLVNFKTKPWHIYSGNPPKIIGKIDGSKIRKLYK